MQPKELAPEAVPSRWQIFRGLLVFQYKLLIDATKDFLLSPLSLGAALVDLFRPGPPSRMLFPALMALGRKAERAINLFGRRPEEGEWTVDRLVDDLEASLQQRRGSAKKSDGEQQDKAETDQSKGEHR